ncbi:VP8 [Micromonas pusilla reovirus]|uniref:Putative non-structural protein 2 n=1 Tax=Micromonas pusilla reovirus (isolate Netherlands/2005) TaxID=649596 RepID=NS2_MPRVN|nr:VP8 [Micromonas pusilla reovirus]Q1I0U4.1 RecName: Full=Putative non-structural protein 2; Short=NS2 [Micromonas pusilla reovirus (isolate Netherlands)]AAZ94048.1 VP8 [Micromonas pusilla reovirus]
MSDTNEENRDEPTVVIVGPNDAQTETTDSTVNVETSSDADKNRVALEANINAQVVAMDEDQYYDQLELRANEVAADAEIYEAPDQPANYRNSGIIDLYDEAKDFLDSSATPQWNDKFWGLIDMGGHCNAGANAIFRTVIKALLYKKYYGAFPIIGDEYDSNKQDMVGSSKDSFYTILGLRNNDKPGKLTHIEAAILDMCTNLVCSQRNPKVWFFVSDAQVGRFMLDFQKHMEVRYGQNAHGSISIFTGPIPLRERNYGQNEGSLDLYEVAQVLQCVQNAETDHQVYQLATSPNQLYFKTRVAVKDGQDVIKHVPVEGGLYVKTYAPEFKHPEKLDGQYVEPRYEGNEIGKDVEYTLMDPTTDYHRVGASRVKRYGDTLMEYTETIPRPECGLIVLLNQCYYFAKARLNPFALLEMRLRSRGGAANRIVSRWLEKGEPLMAHDVVQTLENVVLDGAMQN